MAGRRARSGPEQCRAVPRPRSRRGTPPPARARERVRLPLRAPNPRPPPCRRYVRPRARMEPVLLGMRLPGLLPRRGDPLPERARSAPRPGRAHAVRRLGRGAARSRFALRDLARYVRPGAAAGAPPGGAGTGYGHRAVRPGVGGAPIPRPMLPPRVLLLGAGWGFLWGRPGRGVRLASALLGVGTLSVSALLWRQGLQEAPRPGTESELKRSIAEEGAGWGRVGRR